MPYIKIVGDFLRADHEKSGSNPTADIGKGLGINVSEPLLL